MKRILFITILIIFQSCSSSKKADKLGGLNETCRANQLCNEELACVNNKCISQKEACKIITCVSINDGYSHGICIIENSRPVCKCNDGYKRVNDKKCELSDKQNLCNSDTCADKFGSVCVINNGKSECICPVNYKETEGHDMCIVDEELVCKNVKCDANKHMTGFCRVTSDETGIKTYCECERGWIGEKCEDEDKGCDKSLCLNDPNATGECYIDVSDPNKETICICKDGYELDDNTNKCIITQ